MSLLTWEFRAGSQILCTKCAVPVGGVILMFVQPTQLIKLCLDCRSLIFTFPIFAPSVRYRVDQIVSFRLCPPELVGLEEYRLPRSPSVQPEEEHVSYSFPE